MDIRILHDRVAVKLREPQTTTPGGLAIPESMQQERITADVIAVGKGKFLNNGTRQEMSVDVGDVVMIDPEAMVHRIIVGSTTITVVKEADIMLVLEEENG
jgi:chaperonin GroES